MTIRDALAELEDHDLPEVIELIRQMDREIREKDDKIDELTCQLQEREYGGF